MAETPTPRTPTPAKIFFQFPLWLLGTPGLSTAGLVNAVDPTGEKCIPIFTDADFAQHFKDGNPKLAHYSLRPIGDGYALYGLLTLLEKAGFVNLLIDPSRPAGGSRSTDRTNFSKLAEVRAEVKAAFG